MATFEFVKSMERQLTPDENAYMEEYIKTHLTTPMGEIASAMEKQFKTPVTSSCVAKCMMRMTMKE